MNDLLSFKDKKDRNDFLIALVVLFFFGWLFYHTLFSDQPIEQLLDKPQTALAALADKDNDGIADDKDACPLLAGTQKNNGCPTDADGDGVYDTEDNCPYTKGTAESKGCPDSKQETLEDETDTDGDGVIDTEDKCPNERGPIRNGGCPPNNDTKNIFESGTKNASIAAGAGAIIDNKKIPVDTDKDGIYDTDDKCPNLSGVAANNGCPADTDKDGIYDTDDKCPNKAGTAENNGCPKVSIEAEDKAVLDDALQSVQFAPNRAILLNSSKNVLDLISTVLKKYPDYKVAIQGHTDAIGGDANNLILSKERAKACLDYLVSKGIDPNRMTSDGFGETKPVANNNTKAGRRKNRRVEFNLSY